MSKSMASRAHRAFPARAAPLIAVLFWLNCHAFAQTPGAGALIPVGAQSAGGVPVDSYGQAPRSALGYAAPKYVPVCSGGWWPGEGGPTTSGYESAFRRLMYCPRGASVITLLLTNNFTGSGVAESDGASALPINLGVEVNVPAPWSSSTAYVAGQTVTYGRASWTAAVGSTNSPPSATNASWTTLAISTPVPVTCNGSHTCLIPLTATAATTPAQVSQALTWTDPLPVNVSAGGWIAIDGFTNQLPNFGSYQTSHAINVLKGEWSSIFYSESDASLTGAIPANPGGISYQWSPVAVDGIPLTPGPTVCIIGDSISAGVSSYGVSASSLSSGGTGFVASDVGAVLTAATSGASAGAVNTPVHYQIGAVSGGAITTLWPIDNGSYANTALQTTQTLPSTTQNVTGATTGSGATVGSITYGNGHDENGSLLGSGPFQRGLDAAGIPWVAFSRSNDGIAYWTGASGRDYSRIQAIGQIGCSSVIQELGINDIGASVSAATLETYAAALSAQLYGVGVKGIFYTILTPQVSVSTDGFLTAGNQTANSRNAARATYIAWEQTLPAGVMDGVIDIASAVETTLGSGLFKSDGATVCLITCDGIHPSLTGMATWTAPVTTFASSGALK